jgi:hypothetical protein
VVAIVVAAAATIFPDAALARGGGSAFMDSPGYQRALQNSRRQLQQPEYLPRAAEPRHRHGRRHRHHRR